MKTETIDQVISRLGARREMTGINWTWAVDFPSYEAAVEFVEWLNAHDFEHRGVYRAEGRFTTSVRFR